MDDPFKKLSTTRLV